LNSQDYEVEIKGDYAAVEDDAGRLAIRITARLYDEFGAPLVQLEGDAKAEFQQTAYGEENVPRLLGLNTTAAASADYSQRSELWKEAYKSPTFSAQGGQIRAAGDSPYALETLIKRGSDEAPGPIDEELSAGGKPFVAIGKGETFAVRLVNDSPLEAAVNLTIDGVSVFAFSEEATAEALWIVPAKSSVLVRGWHINSATAHEFKVVDTFADTAAARLGQTPSAQIGLISAAFSAAWKEGEPAPADEGQARGTGLGAVIAMKSNKIVRHVGHVRATIVVRYERPPE
jgi:hypothetical protein